MDTRADEGGLLSISQAMTMLRCGKKKIYALHRSGQLELVKLGSSTRVPKASITRLIDELPRKPREK